MPVTPRVSARSLKSDLARQVFARVSAGGSDRNYVFTAPFNICLEELRMIFAQTGPTGIAAGNVSTWRIGTATNPLASAPLASLTVGGGEVTIEAVAGEALDNFEGNGVQIEFAAADLADAAGAAAYTAATKVITVTIDSNGAHGDGVLTSAAFKTLIDNVQIDGATPGHLLCTIDVAGTGFATADDAALTAILHGDEWQHVIGFDNVTVMFPTAQDVAHVIALPKTQAMYIPAGTAIYIEIDNAGTADTPQVEVELGYWINEDV